MGRKDEPRRFVVVSSFKNSKTKNAERSPPKNQSVLTAAGPWSRSLLLLTSSRAAASPAPAPAPQAGVSRAASASAEPSAASAAAAASASGGGADGADALSSYWSCACGSTAGSRRSMAPPPAAEGWVALAIVRMRSRERETALSCVVLSFDWSLLSSLRFQKRGKSLVFVNRGWRSRTQVLSILLRR
jgi:hypothetical protein